MNGTLTIKKSFIERLNTNLWSSSVEFDDGTKPIHLAKYGGQGNYQSSVSSLEGCLGAVLIHLTDRNKTVTTLTVKLPEGVTLSAAYKTQVTTKYTADGTIGAITFA
ncbi:hypothetical protein [Paenibacillus sp. AR247]|uniref:hypothetical protein n=1 Tax=Paenibacillus sp. AR247 TaxID=1631599 RepID=UPI000CFA3252|nr:hypothetical protein [Paenibacillus sp. AR247]PQP85538.1 hypothetical protein CPT76_35770 [Paenibacillus sp. AR247]